MGMGRTKNKRARKPDEIHQPAKWPPPAPTAYFTIGDGIHGYAEAALGAFYDPLQPVYKYKAFIHPGPAKPLEWHPVNGWATAFSVTDLPFITPAIEKAFTPMQYRFEPIQI